MTGAEGSNPSSTSLNATGGPGNDVLRFVTGDSIAGGDGDDTFAYLNTFHSTSLLIQGQGGTDTYQLDITGLPALPIDLAPLSGGARRRHRPGRPGGALERDRGPGRQADRGFGDRPARCLPGPGQGRGPWRQRHDAGRRRQRRVLRRGRERHARGRGRRGLPRRGRRRRLVRSRDEFGDTVVCGAGADIAILDGADSTSGCETQTSGRRTDVVKPKPKFSGAKVSGGKLEARREVPGRASCGASARPS